MTLAGHWMATHLHIAKGIEMLVLSRKIGERVRIGNGITVTIVRISENSVRLGIECDKSIKILRDELGDNSIKITDEESDS